MWAFRCFLHVMQALGAWRLDLRSLDSLRDAGPLIVAPNHPSLLDAVLVVSRLPNALCVMKGALVGNFLLGPAARLARYVRNDSLLKLVTRAGEELRAGGQLVIFPEGTRSAADPIGPLTEAVGALSRRCGVPVQAVIIEADSRFLGKGWPLTACPEFPLEYRVRLGKRFDPPADVRAFTLELERHFRRELAARGAPVVQPSDLPAVEDVRG
jgi:1-acyl-sn-glycerol-3-phosphate acyltransferase